MVAIVYNSHKNEQVLKANKEGLTWDDGIWREIQ